MKRPRHKQVFETSEAYWSTINDRPKGTPNPAWDFDFIGIHGDEKSKYRLSSPLLLVDPETGKRPDFEKEEHNTLAEAIKAAKKACDLDKRLFILVCEYRVSEEKIMGRD